MATLSVCHGKMRFSRAWILARITFLSPALPDSLATG